MNRLSIPAWMLASLLCVAPPASAQDEERAAEQAGPSWAPGPMTGLKAPDLPGRVILDQLGLAMVLPEAWQVEDVKLRQLAGEEAQAIHAGAEAAAIVEYLGKRRSVPLLTIYRAPLAPWRALEKDGKAGPGRVTITTNNAVYVVVRPTDARVDARFGELRREVEDAISTLGIYDARREGGGMPEIPVEWAGTLPDGQPIEISLERGGRLTMRWAGGREGSGQWLMRGPQIMAYVVGIEPMPSKAIVLNYDGRALTVSSWDEIVFGPAGARLESR